MTKQGIFPGQFMEMMNIRNSMYYQNMFTGYGSKQTVALFTILG